MNKKKISNRRKSAKIKILFAAALWTGMLMLSKGMVKGDIKQVCADYLFHRCIQNVTVFRYAASGSQPSFQWNMIFKDSPVMMYLAENIENIGKKNIEGSESMAKYYAGYGSRNSHWSGLGSDMAGTNELFLGSDELVEELDHEKDIDVEAVMSENAMANGKEFAENRKENEDSESDKKKDREQEKAEKPEKEEKLSQREKEQAKAVSATMLHSNIAMIRKLARGKSRSYLMKNFYITDSSTSIDNAVFNVGKMLHMNLTLKKEKKPQILIFHTHGASEGFVDSKHGKKDSIVGVGSYLASVLRKKYHYNVIHDTTEYDRINGRIDRNKAYNQAAVTVKRTLNKYPSIQVVIDLHRDGVGANVKRTAVVNGKRTAQLMFFNGLSRNAAGNIGYLYNPNLQANLSFSLQMKLKCMEKYPNLTKPIYLKGYRYNMHLRKRYLLIELGNENNTVAEAKNAMPLLAETLDRVLSGK